MTSPPPRPSAKWLALGSSTLDGKTQLPPMSDAIAAQVMAAQVRALHELMPVAMVSSLLATLATYVILRERVDLGHLQVWLWLRVAVSVVRLWTSTQALRGRWGASPHVKHVFVALAALDGLSWSALGWWLTPVMRLDVAVITLCMGVGVASMGVMGTYIYKPASLAFVVPNIVPNALYSLTRGDDLGVFACVSLSALMVFWLHESHRNNRRLREMLRLRFESEASEAAKSQALQQAKELADTRSRFVATMSHEMRTPLHGMLGLMRLVRDETPQPRLQRHLDLMRGSGEHLLNVVNQVLEYSRMDATGLPVHRQAFKLDDLLQDLCDTMRVTCADKGLALHLDQQLPAGCWVMGDPTRLRQVLSNLMGNAVKFTRQGSVTLQVRRDGVGRTMLRVIDTGVGIPAHEIDRIFEPFRQAEGTYQRRFGGTGLGLTISRELCQAMGGQLRAESALGEGSVFTCELPLPAARPAAQAEGDASALRPGVADAASPESARPPAAIPHVLLVDDNPVNVLVAEAELKRLGVRVSVAEGGADALAWLARHQPDLVLLDCEMPEMDGSTVAQFIREREAQQGRARLPIVAMTANGEEIFVSRCQPAGMDGYLAKPFERADLERLLQRHIPWQALADAGSRRDSAHCVG